MCTERRARSGEADDRPLRGTIKRRATLESLGRNTLVLILLSVVPGPFVHAQSNDHVFRSWRWAEDIPSPRAAGLGGAFVAIADDSSAAFLNPAGLTLLPKTEIAAGLLSRGAGTSALADVLQPSTRLGSIAGAGLITEKWAIGAYVNEPRRVQSTLSPLMFPDGSQDSGYIEATVRDVGAAVGWRPSHLVRLGLRLNVSHLRTVGESSRRTTEGAEDLRVGMASGTSRMTGNLGVLIEPVDRIRLGLVIQSGASWPVERTAINPDLGVVLDSGTDFIVRAPAVVAGGVAVRLSERVLVAGQLDYVRYGEIQSVLAVRQGSAVRADYHLDNAFEPHAGIEFSMPVRSFSVQLRGGLHSQAPGSLAYEGSDASEVTAFQASKRRLLASSGLSLVSRSGFRTDLAATFGGDRRMLSAGMALRF